ncbi:hypothetical protein S1OALGB6SA_850, partial [Olavius algarvensis spirochete endosymbiont]
SGLVIVLKVDAEFEKTPESSGESK